MRLSISKWWRRWESNPRPKVHQCRVTTRVAHRMPCRQPVSRRAGLTGQPALTSRRPIPGRIGRPAHRSGVLLPQRQAPREKTGYLFRQPLRSCSLQVTVLQQFNEVVATSTRTRDIRTPVEACRPLCHVSNHAHGRRARPARRPRSALLRSHSQLPPFPVGRSRR